MPRRAREKEDRRRFALLDLGFEPGEQFCRELLTTPDVNIATLRKFVSGETHKDKLAAALAAQLEAGEQTWDDVFLAFCQQPRQWLSIKTGRISLDGLPDYGSPEDFLTTFATKSKGAWYGPAVDGNRTWYVYASREKNYIMQASEAVPQPLRWHVVAEVTTRYIALHWNNFVQDEVVHEPEERDRIKHIQFPYWYRIPKVYETLEAALEARVDFPALHTVVLRAVMSEFEGKRGYDWQHLRIRAQKEGVALNARSSRARDISVSGLRNLTKALARSVKRYIGNASDEAKVERELLLTFIHQWGTKSYEFSLDRTADHEDGAQNLLSAHCYFGANLRTETEDEEDEEEETTPVDDEHHGPDDFPHMKCFTSDYGGSMQTRDFLLPYLLRP